ncbi:MAG: amidohydrolase family protein, partial [Nocardioidaceae bacterium]|nr:amidohydrolase family protein [Nocardioidaceae bacterium]
MRGSGCRDGGGSSQNPGWCSVHPAPRARCCETYGSCARTPTVDRLRQCAVPVTLYRGGAVYAPAVPGCSALLVAGDRIAWLGTDEVATGHVDSADEVIDLRGALITPAFVDAHAHVTETGLALAGVDLTAVASVGEALALVERAARIDGGPVLGHGWDERGWAE